MPKIPHYIGQDVLILREQVNGIKINLTLKRLREKIEAKTPLFGDWGGCGCAID